MRSSMVPRSRSSSASNRSRASVVDEVVVLERADPGADVGRQRVERVELRAAISRSIRSRSGSSPAPPSDCGLGVEPPLDARPLRLDDLVQLPADVGERVGELALLEELLPAVAQPVEEVAQAAEVAARRVPGAQAALHQPAQGLADVAVLEHIVRERVDDLVGGQVGQVLAAVPAPVLRGGRQCRVARRGVPVRAGEVAGVGGQEGHRPTLRQRR